MSRLAANLPNSIKLNAAMVVGGLLLLAMVLALTNHFALDFGDLLTRNTVRLSLAWYTAALLGMMQLIPNDWLANSTAGRLVRWCWTWGLVVFIVHVLMATHFFDHWSQTAAIARTRLVSGVGEGVYVSYLFVLLWAADVATWWIAPRRYATRSPWIDRMLHGFMLLMVFNGMIVFETGPIRYAGIVLFAILAFGFWESIRRKNRANPKTSRREMELHEN